MQIPALALHTDLIRLVTTNDRSSGNYVDIFITTIILMYYEKQYRPFLERNKRRFAAFVNILFAGILLVTLFLVSENFLGWKYVAYNFRYLSILYAVVFSLFIISVRMGNPLNRLLSFAPLRYFGIFGFSIYLLHMFVFELVNQLAWPHYVRFFVAAAGVFAIGAICYYAVEKPFIRFSYKLIDRFGLNVKEAAIPVAARK